MPCLIMCICPSVYESVQVRTPLPCLSLLLLVNLLLVSLKRGPGSTCRPHGLRPLLLLHPVSFLRANSIKNVKMPPGSRFKASTIAMATLCCCTVVITMPAPSSALNTPRDNSVTVQNKKQAHRKSVRDDYDEVRGTSSSAASKAPLLNSLFWDEGMDVTRLRTCLKAELSRFTLGLSTEDEQKTASARSKSAPMIVSKTNHHRARDRARRGFSVSSAQSKIDTSASSSNAGAGKKVAAAAATAGSAAQGSLPSLSVVRGKLVQKASPPRSSSSCPLL